MTERLGRHPAPHRAVRAAERRSPDRAQI